MSDFYKAVDAVINGEKLTLISLLRKNPQLLFERSPEKHEATLLHYVAANGVEDELQKCPDNARQIAMLLVQAGADVEATANIYGGGSNSTPLVLLVTSSHPAEVGVQDEIVGVLVRRGGARVDGINDDGHPFASAIAFFYPLAARALAVCGARLDNIVYASSVGDLGRVEKFLSSNDFGIFQAEPFIGLTDREEILVTALSYACLGGHIKVVEKLLEEDIDLNKTNTRNIHGATVTPLHLASYAGERNTVDFLLSRGADKTVKDSRWEADAAGWADTAGHKELAESLR